MVIQASLRVNSHPDPHDSHRPSGLSGLLRNVPYSDTLTLVQHTPHLETLVFVTTSVDFVLGVLSLFPVLLSRELA